MLWLCLRFPTLAREALSSEREGLERLAAWAYQWSSLVSYRVAEPEAVDPTPLLWLELAASRALFGEPAALLSRISTELTQLGYSHTGAIAPCPAGAALLSRAGNKPCALTRAQLLRQLADLPLEWLELSPETRSALHASGLRNIGQVLALPAAALARRFGPQCCRYLARLTGRMSDPRQAFRLPERYQARCEFEQPLHDTTGLLFPLQRLLQEFQGYLRARDRSVQHFRLLLEHPRHDAREATCVPIGLSTPSRDAPRLLMLVRERLQSLTLVAPVQALQVQADIFTAPAIVQRDLFGSDREQLAALSELIDRLRARLGEQATRTVRCHADHRPERACTLHAPEHPVSQTPASSQSRPAALLPVPQPINEPELLLEGPERIESGWWDGAPVRRDYYVARDSNGARLWVFHDLRGGGWYLQGLWV
jgi:protein ImuB